VGPSNGNELPLAAWAVKPWKRRTRGKASRRSISRFRPWASTAALDSLGCSHKVVVLVVLAVLVESMLGLRQRAKVLLVGLTFRAPFITAVATLVSLRPLGDEGVF